MYLGLLEVVGLVEEVVLVALVAAVVVAVGASPAVVAVVEAFVGGATVAVAETNAFAESTFPVPEHTVAVAVVAEPPFDSNSTTNSQEEDCLKSFPVVGVTSVDVDSSVVVVLVAVVVVVVVEEDRPLVDLADRPSVPFDLVVESFVVVEEYLGQE